MDNRKLSFVSWIIIIFLIFEKINQSSFVEGSEFSPIPESSSHSIYLQTLTKYNRKFSPNNHDAYKNKNNHIPINGQHFRVSANNFAPHSFKKLNGEISGNHYEILKYGSYKYNFSYTLEISEGKSTGVQLGNGSWSGMMNDITDGDCDIALVMAATQKRIKAVDFITTPLGVSHLIFVSTIPSKSISNVAFLTPFHYNVWLCIGISFIAGTIGIYSMLQFMGNENDSSRKHQRYLDVVLWTIGLSTEQSIHLPKKIESIAVIWVAFVLIIGTGYKCNLASFLATPDPLKKPTNFLQLHNSNNYKVYFDISGISGYDFFRKSESVFIKNLRKRIIPTSSSSDCVISAFKNELNNNNTDEHSVCVGWDITLPVAIAKNLSIPFKQKDTMYKSSDHILLTYASIAFRKNFSFQHEFHFFGVSSLESGLIQKWTNDAVDYFKTVGKQWWSSTKKDTKSTDDFYKKLDNFHKNDNDSHSLNMKHFTTLFCAFIIGIILAMCVFAWEVISH